MQSVVSVVEGQQAHTHVCSLVTVTLFVAAVPETAAVPVVSCHVPSGSSLKPPIAFAERSTVVPDATQNVFEPVPKVVAAPPVGVTVSVHQGVPTGAFSTVSVMQPASAASLLESAPPPSFSIAPSPASAVELSLVASLLASVEPGPSVGSPESVPVVESEPLVASLPTVASLPVVASVPLVASVPVVASVPESPLLFDEVVLELHAATPMADEKSATTEPSTKLYRIWNLHWGLVSIGLSP
jgi:hypothetical protein